MPIGYTSANCKKSLLKAFLEANEFGKPGDVTKLRKRRKRRAGSDRSASSDQRRRRNFRRIKEGGNECEQKELSPPPFLLFNSRQEGGGRVKGKLDLLAFPTQVCMYAKGGQLRSRRKSDHRAK